MASEVPLNLHHCEYENITWHYDAEVLNLVTENLKTAWTFNSIKYFFLFFLINQT